MVTECVGGDPAKWLECHRHPETGKPTTRVLASLGAVPGITISLS